MLTSLDIPQSWAPALARARAGGALLLLGGMDTGKSTLAAALASEAVAAGRKTAVVDADVGQSHLGPPTCVSVGWVTQPFASLSDLAPERIDFVGSPSPVGHLLGTVASVHAMTQYARTAGAETIIIDTTGLISGSVARALKGAKIRTVDPDVLVAVQSQGEAEPLLAPYRTRRRPEVLRLTPSRRVTARTRTERGRRREQLLASYFSTGQGHALDWKQVPVENSPWTTGDPLPGHLLAHAQDLLGEAVLHAERSAEGLLLIAAEPPGRRGLQEVEDAFGPTRALVASVFEHLLIGVLGPGGETLALGILERVDFPTRRMEVFTPLAAVASVSALRLGFIQVARDGTQLAWLHPTDVG